MLGEASGLVGSEETLGSCFPICPNKSDEGGKVHVKLEVDYINQSVVPCKVKLTVYYMQTYFFLLVAA